MNKIDLSGLKAWALTCVFIVGSLGGILVACTSGYWAVGAFVAGLAGMAVPYLRSLWQ